MKNGIKQKWVAALRSGDYGQGHGALRNGERFCCLGVLCELAVQDGVIPEPALHGLTSAYCGESSTLPERVRSWAGLERRNPYVFDDSLAHLNDGGLVFSEIADLIEAHL
jgi:hypothetical protein